MLELQVLGTLDMSGDTDRAQALELLAKPKATGLLVYLLLGRPGAWCRRDELAGLFWPESDQQHARRALSQLIYQIRQHLGRTVIERRGTEDVRIAPGALGCDALAVLEGLATGRVDAALERYAGDLLPAFHLPDAGGFADWLDRERASLRRAVVEAALTLAGEAATSGNGHQWYSWAARQDMMGSETIHRAMTGLAEAGEVGPALEVFKLHCDAVRRELDLAPDPQVERLAERIRALPRPSPAIGTVVPTLPPSAPKETGARAGTTTRPAPVSRRPGAPMMGLVVLCAVAAVALILALRRTPTPQLDDGIVAVFPFTYQAPGDADRWLASALPLGLVPLLDGTGGLRAVPEQRMNLALTSHGKSWESNLDADDARTIAASVGAGAYLTASVVSDGAHRRLSATLTRTRSGDELQHLQFVVDTMDVNAVMDRLLAEMLIRVAGHQRQAAELLTQSIPALRHYVDGAVARREQRYLDALRAFQSAMAADSTFALAALAYRETAMWLPDGTPHRLSLELADSIMRRHPERLSAADRAVSDGLMATYRQETSGRETLRILRQATLVAPNRPLAWMLLGDFLLHDGRMLDLPDASALAAAAFDSVRALGDQTPEAERHLIEIHLAERDTAFAREYLAAHPRDPQRFSHLWWVAASLVEDTAALEEFGRTLHREPRSTWRWMMLWSQRAATGFEQADRAADLLAASVSLDSTVARERNGLLGIYSLNRGRPSRAATVPPSTLGGTSVLHPVAEWQLMKALVSPAGWYNRDSIARRLASEPRAGRDSEFLSACVLGVWHAGWGDSSRAVALAAALKPWHDHPAGRIRSYATACHRVIVGALDPSPDQHALLAVADFLGDEPAGVLRSYISFWNLCLSDLLAARGRTEDALRLTTRRGYVVEGGFWITAALVREADLSLAMGDTVRAARAYDRVARFLSDPEPEVADLARRVRLAAEATRQAAIRIDQRFGGTIR